MKPSNLYAAFLFDPYNNLRRRFDKINQELRFFGATDEEIELAKKRASSTRVTLEESLNDLINDKRQDL